MPSNERQFMAEHLARIERNVTTVEDWDCLCTDPLVSVCITTYNHEDFIVDALKGVLMQETRFPYEVIIAEDNSADRTRTIVRDYQQRHPDKIRLRLATENLYSKNKRYPALGARKAARGKYIAQCEGDDYWTDPKKLQKQIDFLEDHPGCTICYTAAEILDDESGQILRGVRKPEEVRESYSLAYVLRRNPFSYATAVYRSGLCEELPSWFFVGVAGDYCLLVLCARKGDVGYIDEKCAVHRRHDGGVHSTLDTLTKIDRAVEVREAILPDLESRHRGVLGSTIYSLNRRGLRKAMNRENAAEVRKHARKCWSWWGYSNQSYFDILQIILLLSYNPFFKDIFNGLRKMKNKIV